MNSGAPEVVLSYVEAAQQARRSQRDDDWQRVAELLAEEVVWQVAGDGTGELWRARRGRAEVLAALQALEAAGYVLRLREPDWFQHRLLKGPDTDLNLHVFSAHCPETDRMLLFRDWLRGNASDRKLYVRTKRELTARSWTSVQQYADTKTAVIGAILARAQGGDTP